MKFACSLCSLLVMLLYSLSVFAIGKSDSCLSNKSSIIHSHIYYPLNRSDINENYMGNANRLKRIKRYLSSTTKIDSIVIYSYASPDGRYAFNKRLAYERGLAAKRFILENIPQNKLADSLIIIASMAENWEGLRNEVEKRYELADKDEVLAILEMSDLNNGRRKELLRSLNGGKSWSYIIKNIMPDLRYATWMSVYYPLNAFSPVFEKPHLFAGVSSLHYIQAKSGKELVNLTPPLFERICI